MTQAVVRLSGKQYLVSEGQTFTTDSHVAANEQEILTQEPLMTIVDDKPTFGTPIVTGAKVTLKVLSLYLGEKVTTSKYHAKTRHRRKVGHRQPQTKLEVTKITTK